MKPLAPISRGFALVEVLVTMVIAAFGLLALAGLIGRTYAVEADATQRSQALLLMQDIVDRINANRKNAANYATGSVGVSGGNCSTAPDLASRDKCEWANLLAGTNEQIGTSNAGVLVGTIGCIYQLDPTTQQYAIAIAWQGQTSTAAPVTTQVYMQCGQNQFGTEDRRRVVTSLLRIGSLAATP